MTKLRYGAAIVLSVILAAGAGTATASDGNKDNASPNILWIVGENLKLDLGCYGAKNVETPNLDSLAAKGVRYTRVFSTAPVCATSRSAFMTGMYQTTTDTHAMWCHRDDDFRLPEGVRPITHRLKDAGYFTANIKTIGDRVVGSGKLDLNFVNEGPIYQSDDWSKLKSHQPFFAQINMPEVEYDIYERSVAHLERVKWTGEDEHPQIATPDNVEPPPYYPDHQIVREEWARYLNSISGMDRRIGTILKQLREEGLEDNTIVVFFGDNGRLEARGIHWCYDSGVHVPMIIHWPENLSPPKQLSKPGSVSEQLISLLDLTATTLMMAGIERPLGMQSRLFLGDRAAPPRTYAFSARDRLNTTLHRIRSVRGKRYHYIRNFMPEQSFTLLNRYKEKCFLVKPLMRQLHAQGKLTGAAAALMTPRLPDEELYDTQTDPHEINNLVDSTDPEHRLALERGRAALDTWITETGDVGHRPEPPEVMEGLDQVLHDWFGTPDWYSKPQEGE